MNSIQLCKICLSDKIIKKYFIGVFAVDMLPKSTPVPFCLIANTMPSNDPGEHWVAAFVDHKNVGHYFCSYGMNVESQPRIKSWLESICNEIYCYPSKKLQFDLSTTCGQYAIMFLHFVCRGVKPQTVASCFSNNHFENDEIVTAFINGLYKADFSAVNTSFLRQMLT